MMTEDWNLLLLLPGGPYLVCARWRQKRLQELPCVRVLAGGYVFRSPGHQNLSATVTTFRSQINNPVCSFDDIQVVLNDDNGIALIAEMMQHGQKLARPPKELLAQAGFEVREPAESHLCCGSAGTYNMMQPEISGRLKDRKAANLDRTKADVMATGNIGCMVQLEDAVGMPVVHTVELLDWATGGPKPAGLE